MVHIYNKTSFLFKHTFISLNKYYNNEIIKLKTKIKPFKFDTIWRNPNQN